MAGSEQNTHCSLPLLLFEVCSKGGKADSMWKHLLNKQASLQFPQEKEKEKQYFTGPTPQRRKRHAQ